MSRPSGGSCPEGDYSGQVRNRRLTASQQQHSESEGGERAGREPKGERAWVLVIQEESCHSAASPHTRENQKAKGKNQKAKISEPGRAEVAETGLFAGGEDSFPSGPPAGPRDFCLLSRKFLALRPLAKARGAAPLRRCQRANSGAILVRDDRHSNLRPCGHGPQLDRSLLERHRRALSRDQELRRLRGRMPDQHQRGHAAIGPASSRFRSLRTRPSYRRDRFMRDRVPALGVHD